MSTLTDSLRAALDLAAQQDVAIAALQEQRDAAQTALEALRSSPREAILDNTGRTEVGASLQAILNRGDAFLPAGDYLIDVSRALTVRRGATFAMDPQARLLSAPHGLTHSVLLTAEPMATIRGGQLIGERFAHDYSASGTHEWVYGLKVGDDVVVDDVSLRDFTGDAVCMTGDRVVLRRLLATRSRRNNMSVFASVGLRVYDSTFAVVGTVDGQAGADKGPWANVDVEPDKGLVDDALFDGCNFLDAQSAGLLLWTRANTGAAIRGVVARRCRMAGNPNGFSALGAGGSIDAALFACTLGRKGKGTAARIEAGATVTIGDTDAANANTFIAPVPTSGVARTPFDLVGRDARTQYDVFTPANSAGAHGVVAVGLNHYQ